MSKWRHKDVWNLDGDHFMVQVSRHSVPLFEDSGGFDSEGPHRWCVYAYIYPKHWHFAAFNGTEDMWQEAAAMLPLHCGPSFCKKHSYASGDVASYQVGADYDHLHDWQYTQMATKEDAYSVFSDAEGLHAWLTESAK